MLEAQPLHGIGQLDVDAEVVGVQLELIALEQPGVLVDVHEQLGDLAVEFQLPVAIALGLGLKIDALGHGVAPDAVPHAVTSGRHRRSNMHYYSYKPTYKCIIMAYAPDTQARRSPTACALLFLIRLAEDHQSARQRSQTRGYNGHGEVAVDMVLAAAPRALPMAISARLA